MSTFKFDAWPTEHRHINQYFAANPQNYAQFGLPGHEGLDIMAPSGSKIFAVAPGRVAMVRTTGEGHNYGIHVRIEHIDGWQTIYAHLQEANVNVGQQVQAGSLLGRADNTGNSFGSHLHLTLKRKGHDYKNWPYNIFDPTPFLLPLLGWQKPAGPFTSGWAYSKGITITNDLAQANYGGINLRAKPSVNGKKIDLVPAGTIMVITGKMHGLYIPVDVPTVALKNIQQPVPAPVAPPPTPAEDTVLGWAFSTYIYKTDGNLAVVGEYGINLRIRPQRNATNIGLVSGGSTITIIGQDEGEYTPARVRRTDFSGPIHATGDIQPPKPLPDAPTPSPEVAPQPEPEPTPPPLTAEGEKVLGWAFSQNLTIDGRTVTSGRFGTNLRARPVRGGQRLGLFIENSQGELAGLSDGEYTPVRVPRSALTNVPDTLPVVHQPTPLPGDSPPETVSPLHDTTPGWAFTAAISASGGAAYAGQYGIMLRDGPSRDAQVVGFVPANASMIVTGNPQGEYTPVRVDDDIIQPAPTTPAEPTSPTPAAVEPVALGSARIGLHASADPTITQAEVDEFARMRPGMIKVLSFHNPEGIKKLKNAHPDVKWVVRAFLDFRSPNGVRQISPNQFLNDTISDVRRTLNIIGNVDVVVELHNEPNLVPEGLTGAWQDGTTFTNWWLEVLRLYRQAIPGMRFIYPGLSPGHAVSGLKHDHIQFIEASRAAVDAADGLAIHTYWSNVYPMKRALDVLDDYISRFRFKPIWITEASNNKAGTPTYRKAQQYLDFWQEIQKRPTVEGVTYFVASASDPAFREEVWVGRNIAEKIGRR